MRRIAHRLPVAALLGVMLLLVGADAAQQERFATVVIDPGHGGDDEGARGRGGLVEKDLVLDVARRLGRRLEQAGLTVVLTRSGDRFVGLEERTSLANDARGDLFVSIHANAASFRRARGVETFFASLEASDDSARELASRENEAFGGEASAALERQDPLLAILGDLIATEHLRDSQEFAAFAQVELSKLGLTRSRGVKQAPFVVLMGVQMPAALVEIGFVTNPEDERALGREAQRERIADALARAVRAYAERHDARRGIEGRTRRGGG